MYYTATYSPDDNKLRLYASARLDEATYQRVKAAGFIWAAKQGLFVAPAWSPSREDLLIELAGEIEDEDKTLTERAEERAERFEDYSDKRGAEAESARKAVSAIADNIPFGQPILVGHHSERHARRDAEKIENGMRRAVKLWETSEYWTRRAAGAISHAKYKERPDVRARRIKTIEADRRKTERSKKEAELWLKLWTAAGDETEEAKQLEMAKAIANRCWLHLPRKEGDAPGQSFTATAYDALNNSHPTLYAPRTVAEVIEHAKRVYPRTIEHCNRWLAHQDNRLAYERAMLAESGGTVTDKTGPEKGGACRCWASPGYGKGWSYIVKVNRVSVSVLDNWGNGGANFTRVIPFDKLKGVMTKAQVDEVRAAGRLQEDATRKGFYLMESREQWDAKREEKPATDRVPEKATAPDFEAMRETLRQGVQVVTAPQLFPTPPDLAARMVELADIRDGQEVLEPSAGTGAIVDAIRRAMAEGKAGRCAIMAAELNHSLAHRLAFHDCLGGSRVYAGDFLECNGNLGTFDRIVMNPPFENGADIKHIEHALDMLRPGGRLVAICANGPRQQAKLRPLADLWEQLPAGTFDGTGVNAALLVIEKGLL